MQGCDATQLRSGTGDALREYSQVYVYEAFNRTDALGSTCVMRTVQSQAAQT
jgi:hypothetical protein